MQEKEVWQVIARLEKLTQRGLISFQEFEAKKQELLAQIDERQNAQPTAHLEEQESSLAQLQTGKLDVQLSTRKLSAPSPIASQLPDSKQLVTDDPWSSYIINNQKEETVEPGQLLSGRYRLERVLGTGGMGQVFLAQDIRFGGSYALKVIHPWVVKNEQIVLRFIQEFKVTERLNHPGIVRTYVLDEDPSTHYLFYTMEFVDGETIQSILHKAHQQKKRPPMDLPELMDFLDQLHEILSYAHHQRIVHRDLKPANIIMDARTRRIKLVDFGIAKALTETNPTYHTGYGGTFYYIAPEQLAGGEEVTPAADIFSAGVLIYQLLTGEIPVAMAVPPSELNPSLSSSVDVVIRRAMHPRPRERYQSFSELHNALLQALKRKPYRPPSRKTDSDILSPIPSGKQNEGLANNWQELGPHYNEAVPHEAMSITRRASAPSAQGQRQGLTSSTFQRLSKSPQINNITAQQQGISTLDLNPSGELLASGGQDHNIKIWETTSWLPLHALDAHDAPICDLQWSPDGRYLATSSQDQTLRIWDIYSTTLLHVFPHNAVIRTVIWNPLGHQLLSGSDDGCIRLWDVKTGDLLYEMNGHEDAITCLHIDEQNKFLASGSQDTSIRLWELRQGECVQTFGDYWTQVNAVCFTESSNMLISATDDATIKLWELASGRVRHTFRGHSDSVTCIRLSPDRQHMMSGGKDGTIKLWNLLDGEHVHTFFKHEDTVQSMALHSQGRWLASAGDDDQIKIWDTSPWLRH